MTLKLSKTKKFLKSKKYIAIIIISIALIIVGTVKTSYSVNYTRTGLQNRVVATALSYLYNHQYSDYAETAIDTEGLNPSEEAGTSYTYAFRSFSHSPDAISRYNRFHIDCSSFATSTYINSIGYNFNTYYNIAKSRYLNRKKTKFTTPKEMTESLNNYVRGTSTDFFIDLARSAITKETGPVTGIVYRRNYQIGVNNANQYSTAKYISDKNVVLYLESSTTNTKDWLKEVIYGLLEPGDLFVHRSPSGGHVVVYVGDKVGYKSDITKCKNATKADEKISTTCQSNKLKGAIEAGGNNLERKQYSSNSGYDLFAIKFRKQFDDMIIDKTAGHYYAILRPLNSFCGTGTAADYKQCEVNNDTTSTNGNSYLTRAQESTARMALSKFAIEQYATDSDNKAITKYGSVNTGKEIKYTLRIRDRNTFGECFNSTGRAVQAVTSSKCSDAAKEAGKTYTWQKISSYIDVKDSKGNLAKPGVITATIDPDKVEYVRCDGCTKSGNELKWTFSSFNKKTDSSLSVNDLYLVTYTVKPKVKGTITGNGFTVGNTANSNKLQLGTMQINVENSIRRFNEAKIRDESTNNNTTSTNSNIAYARDILNNAYGNNWAFLTNSNIESAIFYKFTSLEDYEIRGSNVEAGKPDTQRPSATTDLGKIYQMMVPGMYGGYRLRGNDLKNRIKYISESDFEIGDIIYRKKHNDNVSVQVYMGNGIFRTSSSSKITNGDTYLYTSTLHNDKLFVVLRPSRIMGKINYSLNGGSGTTPSQFFVYGTYKNINTSTIPTKSGYVFGGWTTTTTPGTEKLTSTSTIPSAKLSSGLPTDHTLYARWLTNVTAPTATTYCNTLIYNGKNQTLVKTAGTGFTWTNSTGNEAKAYTVTAKLSSGYVWANSNNSTADKTITCSIGKRTLKVTANNQTIEYGKTIADTVNNVTVSGVAEGHIINKITLKQSTTQITTTGTITPSAAGVIDSSSKDVTNNYNITYVTGSLTIKSLERYTVTFNSNGGSSVAAQTITKGDKVNQPNNPIRTGYSFGGWYSNSTLTSEYDFNKQVTSGMTLYAKWIKSKYQVMFNTSGGSSVATQEVEYEGMAIKPTNPSKEGHIFVGWYTNFDFTTEYDFSKKVTKSITIYAKWIERTYSILYTLNGGIASNPSSYTINTNAFTLNRPTKTGSTFKGWTGSNGSSPQIDVTIEKGTTGNKSYIANYDAIKFIATFDSNGGSSVADQTISYGEKVNEPATPTKEGFAFAGWYTDDSLTNKYNFNTVVTSNITLYAKWVAGKYQITYNLNGGIAENPTYYDIETETFILNNPTKTGTKFIGWTGSNGSSPQKNVTIEKGTIGNLNYTANYENETYKIVFDYEGIDPIEGEYGSNVELPAAEKEGYRFIGWYKDEELTEEFNLEKMPSENITLYPKWETNRYRLIFRTNGGNGISSIEYMYNEEILSLPTPIKEGYRFIGWYKDEGLTEEFNLEKMPSSNVIVYAKWEGNTHTVSFRTSGGSVIEDAKVISGDTLSRPSDPTRNGYIFGDWYSDNTYTTVYDFDGPVTSDLVLYASWEAREYRIEYDLDGGKLSKENPTNYNATTETFTLNNPEKVGYTFTGWTGSNGETPQKNVTIEKGAIGHLNYKANYSANNYTITFNSNGGSIVNSITRGYGAIVDAPENPTKTGYKFAGWYRDSEFTRLYSFTIMPSEDMTLYAKWTNDSYTISYMLDGGINNESNPTTYNGGDEKEIKEPSREGYRFVGWYRDSAFENKVDSVSGDMNGDMMLYAKWEINKYQIMFETNGATDIPNMEIEYGSKINIRNPIKTGHTFKGWYMDEGLTELFTLDRMLAKDITVYARWEVNKYTINFNVNGGNKINPITAEYDSIIKEPNKPLREGYKFAGWYIDKALTKLYSFDRMPAKNMTLYAKWINNSRNTIKYVLNGGKNNKNNKTSYINGEDIKLYNPIKNGSEFAGWYLESDYQTRVYSINKKMNGDLTLYAKWGNETEITVPDTGSNTSVIAAIFGLVLMTLGVYFVLSRKQKL